MSETAGGRITGYLSVRTAMAVFISSTIGIMLTFLFEGSYDQITDLIKVTESIFWAFVILIILQTELPIIGTIDTYFSKLNQKLSNYSQKRKQKQKQRVEENMKNVVIVINEITEETYLKIFTENFRNEYFVSGGFLINENMARFVFAGEDHVPAPIREMQKNSSESQISKVDQMLADIKDGKPINIQNAMKDPTFVLDLFKRIGQTSEENQS